MDFFCTFRSFYLKLYKRLVIKWISHVGEFTDTVSLTTVTPSMIFNRNTSLTREYIFITETEKIYDHAHFSSFGFFFGSYVLYGDVQTAWSIRLLHVCEQEGQWNVLFHIVNITLENCKTVNMTTEAPNVLSWMWMRKAPKHLLENHSWDVRP